METDGTTHLISLGAGVQSSTMALMAAAGEITPMPKAAIFADTQDEPASVYRWLDWLEKQLPFPVHRVTKGKLSEEAVRMRTSKKGSVYSRTDIPFFTLSADGDKGKIPSRSCTADYKIKPIIKAARDIVGRKKIRQWQADRRDGIKPVLAALAAAGLEAKATLLHAEPLCVQWIGISLDEMRRMKPSREPWTVHRWPLVEKRMSRLHCLDWMKDHGHPEPPKSACVYCPFHSSKEWRRLQTDEPAEFERAVQIAKANSPANFKSIPFLHRSCKPLDEIDFRSDVERGQGLLPGWDDECEGMCGV